MITFYWAISITAVMYEMIRDKLEETAAGES
jgi:hypothetical protein